jgi:ribokinase
MSADIVVLGSLNMDFVVRVERHPAPGETLLGSGFRTLPGGKGANQACAAGKLSAGGRRVGMFGRVGYDVFGDQLKASLAGVGVDVSGVHATQSEPTGVAFINVDAAGQNVIIVASGANNVIEAKDAPALAAPWRGARFALFQLETPLPAVAAAMRVAKQEGVQTLLDPAPARALPEEFAGLVDIVTPNESEACILAGETPRTLSVDDARALVRRLSRLAPTVVLKLGEKGCLLFRNGAELYTPGFSVAARDTTAAGDVFNGALAVALAEEMEWPQALRFACAAAAISVTREGAQASVPMRTEVDAFLSERAAG